VGKLIKKRYKKIITDIQTATVFLHAHLQVLYYNCVKFHKNSISSLVGVALTRYMNPPTFTKKGVMYLVSATPPKRLIGVL
jgi:hypothetical protein